jgi:hypothetical protein
MCDWSGCRISFCLSSVVHGINHGPDQSVVATDLWILVSRQSDETKSQQPLLPDGPERNLNPESVNQTAHSARRIVSTL